jgi:hypothetical protein
VHGVEELCYLGVVIGVVVGQVGEDYGEVGLWMELERPQQATPVKGSMSGWRKVSGGVQWLRSRSISRSRSPHMRSKVSPPSAAIGSDPWLSKEK